MDTVYEGDRPFDFVFFSKNTEKVLFFAKVKNKLLALVIVAKDDSEQKNVQFLLN